jgi:hypothetical protein
VKHPCGAPPFALRLNRGWQVLYHDCAGDTEWIYSLREAASGSDLRSVEAYFLTKEFKFHLDFATLGGHLPEFVPSA